MMKNNDEFYELEGHKFKVISYKEADKILGDFGLEGTDVELFDVFDEVRFPEEKENNFFLLAEEDVTLEKFQMDIGNEEFGIAGIIFMKNLTVKQYIMEYDTDYSPMFAVLGDLKTKNISLGGNLFFVNGDVDCECIYGFYNQGELYVNGLLSTDLLIAKDFRIYIGELDSYALINTDCVAVYDESYTGDGLYVLYPTTCKASDVMVDEIKDELFWGTYMPDNEKITEYFLENKSVIDKNKLKNLHASFNDAELTVIFDKVFNNPKREKDNGTIEDENGDSYFTFIPDDENKRHICYLRGSEYNYQFDVVQNFDEDRFEIYHTLWNKEFTESESVGYIVDESFTVNRDPIIEAVIYGFYCAAEKLTD